MQTDLQYFDSSFVSTVSYADKILFPHQQVLTSTTEYTSLITKIHGTSLVMLYLALVQF